MSMKNYTHAQLNTSIKQTELITMGINGVANYSGLGPTMNCIFDCHIYVFNACGALLRAQGRGYIAV